MTTLEALGAVAAFAIGGIPISLLAYRIDQNARLAQRLALAIAVILVLTIGYTIATGELLRFAPGGGEIEDCGASLVC